MVNADGNVEKEMEALGFVSWRVPRAGECFAIFEKAPDMLTIETKMRKKEGLNMDYESRYKQTLHSIETRLYELDKYSAYRRPLSAYDAGRYLELAAMYYSLTGTIWEIAK